MQARKIVFLLAIALSACSASADSCRLTGFSEEVVCDVTFSKLILVPMNFDRKLVELRGYYAVHTVSGAEKKFLFMSREAELTADYGAAVELGSLSVNVPKERAESYAATLDKPNRPLIVIGQFNSEPRRLPNGRSAVGLLAPIVGVNPVVPPPRKRVDSDSSDLRNTSEPKGPDL